MAHFPRIFLFAFSLVLVASAAGSPGPAGSKAGSQSAVRNPARISGSVPLKASRLSKQSDPRALGRQAARLAAGEIGVPYLWGGSSPNGFDCSGLIAYVYGKLGVSLPHNAAAQYSVGRPVVRSRLRAGDLVFFESLGHVGLYVGRGRVIHAPRAGRTVEVKPLSRAGTVVGTRRVAIA